MNKWKLQNGDDHREDGYVYRNGQKIRKWFTSRAGWNHFWSPLEKQTTRLESLYCKLHLRIDKRWEKIETTMREIVSSGKTVTRHGKQVAVAHATVTHDMVSPKDKPGWWAYYVGPGTFSELSFSYDWIEAPEKPINQDLGQKLYRLDYGYCFRALIGELLDDSIRNYIIKNLPLPKPGQGEERYDLKINGRSYFYHAYRGVHDSLTVERLYWFGDRTHIHTID